MAAVPLASTSLFSDANLVSYWKYDETSGTSAADSKGSNTGTASSSAILNNAGKFSNGATFVKASSHKITHGDIFALNAYTDMTFSFWFKTSSSGVDDSVISNYAQSGGGGGYSIDLRADNKIHLDTWNTSGGNSGDVATGATVNDGNWHHIVVVKTSTTAVLYLDASAGSSGSITPVTPSSAGNFHVGGEPNIYGYSDCSVDDLAVFSRALTAQEISDLFNGSEITINVNEAVTVSESVVTMVDMNPSVVDSITVTENVAIDFPFEVSVFDAITVAESVTMLIDLNPSVNDAITITENITTSIDLGDISVSDAITITEFAAFEFAPYEISVNDVISLTEYVQTEQENFISVTDTITVSENVSQPMFSDPVRGVVHMRSQQQLYPLPMDDSEIL